MAEHKDRSDPLDLFGQVDPKEQLGQRPDKVDPKVVRRHVGRVAHVGSDEQKALEAMQSDLMKQVRKAKKDTKGEK